MNKTKETVNGCINLENINAERLKECLLNTIGPVVDYTDIFLIDESTRLLINHYFDSDQPLDGQMEKEQFRQLFGLCRFYQAILTYKEEPVNKTGENSADAPDHPILN